MARALLALVVLCSGCRPLLGLDEAVLSDGAVVEDDAPAGSDASDSAPPPDETMVVDWWNPDYPFRHTITFDATGLAVPLPSMPLLVRLPSTAIGTSAAGDDLRFVDTSNTRELPFEIESISASGAVVWVLVDLTATTSFYVYGGTATPTVTSNGAGVFGSYELVHHLQPALTDSSGHAHTASGLMALQTPADATGVIGQARLFDGQNDSLRVANDEPVFDYTTAMSASAWIEVQDFNMPYQGILTKGDTNWRLQRDNATNHVAFDSTTTGLNEHLVGTVNVANGAWHHVALSLVGGTKSLYVDGILEGTAPTAVFDTNDNQLRIGGNSAITGRWWKGKIDEARISPLPRTAAQFKADFEMVMSLTRLAVGVRELR